MNHPALRFHQVVKTFEKKKVLQALSLDVVAGEFFGLVGMNGAGKTTLLKCLFDFCTVDSGQIEIFGKSNRLPNSREPVAFVPERFIPPYYLTGRDFLQYMLKLQGLPYDEERALACMTELDLDGQALVKAVRLYSKGMTQKLGLTAAFLANKALYVFDEPMSGLDPKARALLKQKMQQLRLSQSTLFFSSHALADVEEMCDRMAILHDGQLRFIGTPEQCIAQYQAKNLEQAYLQCIA
jgi:ABC-2 type transport system ATP-binding protein